MQNSESATIERVIPDDGRQETGWLLVMIGFILALATGGLHLNQDRPAATVKHMELSVTGREVLTALRNAADEIMFLSEDGQTLPGIEELAAEGLPPFADTTGAFSHYRWSMLASRCYYGGSSQVGQPRFILRIDDVAAIFWQVEEHADHGPPSSCNQLDNWQTVSL